MARLFMDNNEQLEAQDTNVLDTYKATIQHNHIRLLERDNTALRKQLAAAVEKLMLAERVSHYAGPGVMEIRNLRTHTEKLNLPLTMEELREMDGESVGSVLIKKYPQTIENTNFISSHPEQGQV